MRSLDRDVRTETVTNSHEKDESHEDDSPTSVMRLEAASLLVIPGQVEGHECTPLS